MTQEAKKELLGIIYELHSFPRGSYYEVFWYHWPSDGLLPWEDYEPVVFAYDNKQELCFILIRRAWRYIIFDPDEVFWPPEVLFKGINHHQFVRRVSDDSEIFSVTNLSWLSTVSVTESNVILGSQCIPPWNVSGLSHDIYEKTEEILSDSCNP